MNPVKLILYIKQSEQIFIDIYSFRFAGIFSFQSPSDYSPSNPLQIILLSIPFRLFSFQSPSDYSPFNSLKINLLQSTSEYSPSNTLPIILLSIPFRLFYFLLTVLTWKLWILVVFFISLNYYVPYSRLNGWTEWAEFF